MAATGWLASLARRAPLVLNVQDIFPDVAVELGLLTNRAHDQRRSRARTLVVRALRGRDRAVRRHAHERGGQASASQRLCM